MADSLLTMTLGVGASLVKVLLQANDNVTEANVVEVIKEGCGILSWWKNRGDDARDQLAKQIDEILAYKTHDMYEECRGKGIDEERLGGVVTEVEILFDKVVGNDELLLLAVNDPASFSEVLQDDIGQRRKNIESRLEPYFDKLVKAAVDEYVKLAPWSPKFQIEALKDLTNKVDEILKNTVKGLENDKITHEELDDLPNKIASVVKDCDYSQERVLGPDHFDTLTARNNLAGAYGDVGCFGEAIELFEQVLAEQERVLGPDHPDTLITRNNLAGAYHSAGRFGEAIELYEQVLAEYERVLGDDHPDTFELFEQVLGDDHPDTLTVRDNLAGAYDSVGRFGEAIELYEQVLAGYEWVLGDDHPDTLTVRDNLAGAYDSVGRFGEAIDAWEELLPDCQRVLGLEHPLTKRVEKNLEAAKRKMNPPDTPSPETGEE